MKIKPLISLCTTLAALSVAAVVYVPEVRADEKADLAAAKKALHDKEMLEKYDKNHDGKLDDDEIAVMKADEAKAKAEKKAAAAEKKKKKEVTPMTEEK
jgi:hypothetical protein